MEISKKVQESGDHCLNVQAENFTINTGLTIAHVREIALEVFHNNFYQLAGLAKETASQRAKEITDQFLEELATRNPAGIAASEDPDFQHSLFTAQKEYARCGDKELGDILVDILVDRTKQPTRTLLQIVLNESLSVAPKLNPEQLDLLACCFNIAYTRRLNIKNIADFASYLNDGILIFSEPIASKDSNYRHLEYVGCASIKTGHRDLIAILMTTYPAIFSKGFQRDKIENLEAKEPNIIKVIIPCLHDSNLIQAGGMDDNVIVEMCKNHGISSDVTTELIQINKAHIMNNEEAKEFLSKICPKFRGFIEDSEKSQFRSLELTSVGIAIAHAHSRKKAGFDADLSIWI